MNVEILSIDTVKRVAELENDIKTLMYIISKNDIEVTPEECEVVEKWEDRLKGSDNND